MVIISERDPETVVEKEHEITFLFLVLQMCLINIIVSTL